MNATEWWAQLDTKRRAALYANFGLSPESRPTRRSLLAWWTSLDEAQQNNIQRIMAKSPVFN